MGCSPRGRKRVSSPPVSSRAAAAAQAAAKASTASKSESPPGRCGCETAEHRRTGASERWCWGRLLGAPWTARRSILKEISLEYSLEGLMLKLKLQYFGHLSRRTDSLEKALMLGKIEGRRRRGRRDEMVGWHHRLDRHEFEQAPGSLDAAVHGVAKSRT